MFTFSLVTGVRNGWLTDPKYAAAARKGWIALGNKANGQGQLSQVCPGTGAAPDGSLSRRAILHLDHLRLERHARPGTAPLGRQRAPAPGLPGRPLVTELTAPAAKSASRVAPETLFSLRRTVAEGGPQDLRCYWAG